MHSRKLFLTDVGYRNLIIWHTRLVCISVCVHETKLCTVPRIFYALHNGRTTILKVCEGYIRIIIYFHVYEIGRIDIDPYRRENNRYDDGTIYVRARISVCGRILISKRKKRIVV